MSVSSKSSAGARLPEIRARAFERGRHPQMAADNLLSQKQQAELRGIAVAVEYEHEGTVIFSEGEDARFVYLVADGVIRIGRTSDGGRRQILAFMLPGDLLGLPDAGSYVNSADVACPSVLYRIPWAKLRDLMTREPSLQHNFLVKVAHDFREAQRRIVILGQQNTYQRLASFLLDFIQHPAFFDKADRCLTLPLSRFDMADYLGTAPETVARGFLRLERDALVRRVTSRIVEIIDVDGLRRLQMRKRRAET